MYTIYKYQVTPYKYQTAPDFSLELPANAEILDVQLQQGIPQLWVLLDVSEPTIPRDFVIYGTGHVVKHDPNQLDYTGTFQIDGLVFHLFEVQK